MQRAERGDRHRGQSIVHMAGLFGAWGHNEQGGIGLAAAGDQECERGGLRWVGNLQVRRCQKGGLGCDDGFR